MMGVGGPCLFDRARLVLAARIWQDVSGHLKIVG
jgi:hypothetical protein